MSEERVAIVTVDPTPSGEMWLMADYLTEVAELDHRIFPDPDRVASWIGPQATVESIVPAPNSNSQSPPRFAAPVASSDAATSAPVSAASASMNAPPPRR